MPVSSPASKPLDVANPSDALALVIGAAESALGVPYQWGGNSLASGVDCSGLVQRAFAAAGISLPRVSNQQASFGQPVASMSEAKPGDLLSWDNSSRNNGADHIAIYIGNGLMIEAPRRGEKVRVTQVRSGARVNRVLGVVPATNPGPVPLGPNADRKFTAAALGLAPSVADAQAQPEVVSSSTETKPYDGGLGDGLPENATEEETLNYIREHLPQYAGLLANDEIRYVLTWAVREDKGPAEIQGALAKTEYWRTHGATSRQVDIFLGSASQADITRLTNQAKGIVSDLFQRNGVTLDDATLSRVAMDALREGDISLQGFVVNQDNLNTRLAFGLNAGRQGDLPAGETAASAENLLSIARAYLVPMDRRTAEEWAVKILTGAASEDQYTSYIKGLARGQWMGDDDLQAAIEAGIAPSQFFAPHRSVIAETLELSPDQVDLMDPQYRDVVQTVDEKTGRRRSMTLGEVTRWARERPEFANTRQYAQQGAGVATGLAEWLGVAGRN